MSQGVLTVGRRRTGSRWFLRIAVAGAVLALLAQAATAGQLLERVVSARTMHGFGSVVVLGFGLLQLIAAILVWRPARGPGWPALVSLLILFAGFAQSALGGSGNRALHVPLGVSLVVATTWVLVWAWSRRSGSHPA